jgi:hypothetical protein
MKQVMRHFAMVVEDLETAQEQLAATLGVSFDRRHREAVVVTPDGGRARVELAGGFTTTHPYLEVIQATGDGLFSTPGMHHVGGFATHPADVAPDPALGLELEAQILTADGQSVAAAFYRSRRPDGLRLELLDPSLEQPWLDSGRT